MMSPLTSSIQHHTLQFIASVMRQEKKKAFNWKVRSKTVFTDGMITCVKKKKKLLGLVFCKVARYKIIYKNPFYFYILRHLSRLSESPF